MANTPLDAAEVVPQLPHTMMPTRRFWLLGAAGIALGLVAAIVLYGPGLGLFNRIAKLPACTSRAFVERLSVSHLTAAAQRERLLSTWKGKGSYGLKRVQGSVEGTPIALWLVVERGAITLVTDYSRDSYSNRSVQVAHPVALKLGPIGSAERHPLRAWFPRSNEVYLRCILSDGSIAFF